MEKPRRVSIATLCAVVAVVAIDLAWWRCVSGGRSFLGFRGPALDFGAMPMANLLAVGLAYILSNPGRVSPWLIGFLRSGLVGLVVYLIYCWACLVLPGYLVYRSMEPMYIVQGWLRFDPMGDFLCYACLVYYGMPQLLVALFGGLICRNKDRES